MNHDIWVPTFVIILLWLIRYNYPYSTSRKRKIATLTYDEYVTHIPSRLPCDVYLQPVATQQQPSSQTYTGYTIVWSA